MKKRETVYIEFQRTWVNIVIDAIIWIVLTAPFWFFVYLCGY